MTEPEKPERPAARLIDLRHVTVPTRPALADLEKVAEMLGWRVQSVVPRSEGAGFVVELKRR